MAIHATVIPTTVVVDNETTELDALGKIKVKNRAYHKIADIKVTSPVNSIDITGLNGNADEFYVIEAYFLVSGSNWIYLRFNNDSGTNYYWQYTYGCGTSVTASDYGLQTQMAIAYGTRALSTIQIQAKSGNKRYVKSYSASSWYNILLNLGEWNNTTDNITSISIIPYSSYSFQPGTRVVLFKVM